MNQQDWHKTFQFAKWKRFLSIWVIILIIYVAITVQTRQDWIIALVIIGIIFSFSVIIKSIFTSRASTLNTRKQDFSTDDNTFPNKMLPASQNLANSVQQSEENSVQQSEENIVKNDSSSQDPSLSSKIFISYATEDWEVAKRLYDDLRKANMPVWLDKEDLLPGQNWQRIITQVIKNSIYILVLLSSNSVSRRGFVQKEIKIALDVLDEIPPHEIFIIPIRLDNCKPEHEKLQELHRVDLFPNYEEGLNKILRVLRSRTARDAVKLIGSLLHIVDSSEFHLASHYCLEPAVTSLKGWLNKLCQENQMLLVAIVGEFNAGKSTLVNALLEREVAFTHHFTATKALAFYYPEDNEDVLILYQDGGKEHMSIYKYLHKCKHPENLAQVQRVEVHVPRSLNFVLLDTPGMGTLEKDHQDRAEEAVKQADVIVWVIDPNRLMGVKEGAFLRRAREIGLPILVVISKIDDFSKEDIEKSIERLVQNLGYREEQLIALSAQNYLSGHNDQGVFQLIEKLSQMSARPQSIRAQSQSAKEREMIDEAVRLVDRLQEKLNEDLQWIKRERELIQIQAATVEAHLKEFSRSIMMQHFGSHLAKRVSKSLQPDEVESVLNHSLADFKRLLPELSDQLMQQVRDETMGVWKKQFVERQNHLKREIERLLSRPLEREYSIKYLEEQLTEIAFRQETVIKTIETTRNTSSKVGSTLLTIGVTLGAVLVTSLVKSWWGPLLASLLHLIKEISPPHNPSTRTTEETREGPTIRFRREAFIDKLCQEFGNLVRESLSRPIQDYLKAIVNEAIQSMCQKKWGGLTVQKIEDVKREVDQLQGELSAISRMGKDEQGNHSPIN